MFDDEEQTKQRSRNGGPAFPWDGMGDDGMTLRDHFAGLAMQGWLASFQQGDSHPVSSKSADRVAIQSYQMADAMLKARAQ